MSALNDFTAATAAVTRHAEVFRTSLVANPLLSVPPHYVGAVSPDDAIVRLAGTVGALREMQAAAADARLRLEVVCPIAVPANAHDIPLHFLATRKDPELERKDKVAEALGQQAIAKLPTAAYVEVCTRVSQHYDAMANQLMQALRADAPSR